MGASFKKRRFACPSILGGRFQLSLDHGLPLKQTVFFIENGVVLLLQIAEGFRGRAFVLNFF